MYIDEPVAEPKPDEKLGGGDGGEPHGQVLLQEHSKHPREDSNA